MEKKIMVINLTANIFAFLVSFIISFFITPLIVKTVGKETYGFWGLANNFVNYIMVLTVAMNSLAGRFVTISIHRGEEQEAKSYFNSVMITNLTTALLLVIPGILFVANLEYFLEMPVGNYLDIKLTFAFVFAAFCVNLTSSVFSIATFAKNKIYLASIRTIEANIVRLLLIAMCFILFTPKLFYISGALLVSNIFIAITNIRYTRKLLPEIRLDSRYFSISKVKELISSGWWNSLTALSNILLEGLDLLISNKLLGPAAMGTVSIVKTVPSMLNTCLSSLLGVFLPQMTISYAKHDSDGLLYFLDYSIKIVGILIAVPLGFIIVFGREFYLLWLPTENNVILWGLSVISLSGLFMAGSVNILYNLYNVTNHLKLPAIATLVTGVLNTIIVLWLLKKTQLGIIAIVGVSSVLGIARNLLFNIPYSAHCLPVKSIKFYRYMLRSTLMVGITCFVYAMVRLAYSKNTWLHLTLYAALAGCISLAVNFMLFFTKQEKKEITHMFSRRKGRA